ncbi:MAG: hypothetical protein RJQ10_02500 [Haliea sp.]|uniref:hypothetical protein n=1 Tax=Haliea sp. TaxID=1932666 RepID=UPI0032EF4CA8
MNKLFVIGLDGYDPVYAGQLIAQGGLPALARLHERSARFQLDHGSAKRTGLAFEHFSAGLAPGDAKRWSALYFDKDRYQIWQEGVRLPPFTRHMQARTVVFDVPYFDLNADPRVQGVVSWGAHDPGTPLAGQPSTLLQEMLERFGPYPAPEWIYGFAWPSAEKCRAMGEKLAQAVNTRAGILDWLFCQRLPDWDLGIAVVSELHSVAEGLWHGVDPAHPLHGDSSAAAAEAGMRAVYEAVDALVDGVQRAHPDVTLMLFSMHGMGPNESDVSSMALLPELLLRKYLGRKLLEPKPEWLAAADGVPRLEASARWQIPLSAQGPRRRSRSALLDAVRPIARQLLHRFQLPLPDLARGSRLSWMPAAHYQPYWRQMTAFALPSFYDGRIRINLQGRERYGKVTPADYRAVCNEIAAMLMATTNARTGRPAVRSIEINETKDPLSLEASDADIIVDWDGASLALAHPQLGVIGPLPYRRPGGHSGGTGMSYIVGPGIEPGDCGLRSAFDLVPTVFALAGEALPEHLSGASLL